MSESVTRSDALCCSRAGATSKASSTRWLHLRSKDRPGSLSAPLECPQLQLQSTSSSMRSNRPQRCSPTFQRIRRRYGWPWAVPLRSERRFASSPSRQEWKACVGNSACPIIPYPANAFPGDYVQLQHKIAAATVSDHPRTNIPQPKHQVLTPAPPTAQHAFSDDLASYEVMALTIIDRKCADSGLAPATWVWRCRPATLPHLTSHAMNALKRRRFIERRPVQISAGNELYLSENLFLTRTGKDWLVRHGEAATARPHSRSLRERNSSTAGLRPVDATHRLALPNDT